MKRKAITLMFTLLMSTALFAQTFITGSAISDADGERLWFVSLAQYNPNDLTNYLTNIVGLTENDITTASNQVSTFWSQYSAANNTWNLQCGSGQPTQQQINTFNTTQANIVANNWSALQSNLCSPSESRMFAERAGVPSVGECLLYRDHWQDGLVNTATQARRGVKFAA